MKSTNIRTSTWIFGIISFISWQVDALCHDVPVHKGITANATAAAYNDSAAYREFSTVVSGDISYVIATNYIIEGSAREDDPSPPNPAIDGPGGGYRSLNHFYDPIYIIYGRGLSDIPFNLQKLEGVNSFKWASIYNSIGVPGNGMNNPYNQWSWQNARTNEMLGLTNANPSDRVINLTNMEGSVLER